MGLNNQYPARLKEDEFLRFKCQNFLSFVDARRKFSQIFESKSYGKVLTSAQKTDLEELQKIIEARTNAMLKIIIDYTTQQSEKVVESIAMLSSMLANCLAKLSDDSPERRKHPYQGRGS